MRTDTEKSEISKNSICKSGILKYSKISLLFFLTFFISRSVGANGYIKGTVTDLATNEPLVGANVFVQGTSIIGTTTDAEGNYNLFLPLKAGEYTVKCSYIGFLSGEKVVDLKEGETKSVDFRLIYDIVAGKEVVITAQAVGQAAAINQQVNSYKIVNVVSEKKIQELPDANAAEALGRLPGVSVMRSGGEANKIVLRGLNSKMTTVTVDGVKLSATEADSRGIDLSAISQGSISGIELFKAITSDMEAESVGGSVNFVTKSAPEKKLLRLDAHGYYGAVDKTAKQYNFSGRYGERFFDNKLGIQLNANIESRNRSSEKIEMSKTGDPNDFNKPYEFAYGEVFYTPEERDRLGGSFIVDYKLSNTDYIKLNTSFSKTEREFSELSRNYPANDARVTYFIRSREVNIGILNTALQGRHTIESWQIDWNTSYTSSRSEKPYDYQLEFHEPSTIEDGQIVSGMDFIPVKRDSLTFDMVIPYALNNFEKSTLYQAVNRSGDNDDNEKTVFVDVKKSYNLWGFSGELKTGAKYRSHYHEKINDYSYAPYYAPGVLKPSEQLPDGTIADKDFEGYGFSEYGNKYLGLISLNSFISADSREIFQKYPLYPIIDRGRVRDWHDMNIYGIDPNNRLTEYMVSFEEKDQQYSLTENITAGYFMNTLNYGRLITFIAGVRFENDNHTYKTYITDEQSINQYTVFRDTTASYSELMTLPNFHLILRPTDFMNIRFASYKAIARPDFNARLPLYVASLAESGSMPQPYVKLGMTDLKNAIAWNYEANVQFYGNNIGLLSISAYYKEIENEVKFFKNIMIYDKSLTDSLGITFRGDELPFASFELTYPYNSDKPTKVWGLEFEHQANFRYLPGLLKNFVLNYNISLVKSETYNSAVYYVRDSTYNPAFGFWTYNNKEYPAEAKGRLINSAGLFGNVALGYDYKGFSVRVSFFYQDEYYLEISKDRRGDMIQAGYGRLDLSLKQKITNNFSVGLNVNNLNNAWEGKYKMDQKYNNNQTYSYPRSKYSYGTSADIWLRMTF